MTDKSNEIEISDCRSAAFANNELMDAAIFTTGKPNICSKNSKKFPLDDVDVEAMKYICVDVSCCGGGGGAR